MTALFGLAMAVGAALLFSVQPMVARMALPTLGGSPSVWNTCMLFFQACVLAGYALAHGVSDRRRPGRSLAVFLIAIGLGMISLPVTLPPGDPAHLAHPVRWLLLSLLQGVAFPAVALAMTSPLLQRWFESGPGAGRDPYFLYAASNVGSLAALVAYPVVLEPALELAAQSRAWTAVYGVWGVLIAACGGALLRRREPLETGAQSEPATGQVDPAEDSTAAGAVGGQRWWTWVALGAVPASLLQGCTLFLTTDVAGIPLLWVVPLALYLTTFILAFARRGERPVRWANRLLPYLAVGMAYMILVRATQPVGALIGLHLGFLFAAGLVCHGRLVALRPPAGQLTGFYLAMSVGGVLGGAFNSLLAPVIFDSVAEYPLAIAACCLALRPRARGATEAPCWARDVAWATGATVLIVVLALVVPWLTEGADRMRDMIVFGVPAVVCCTLLDRPRRLALALAGVLASGLWVQARWAGTFHAERNFFGVTRVARSGGGEFHQLVHGNTIHGRQFRDPANRGEPLTYYHRRGPLGSLFAEFQRRQAGGQVGVIGLGIGSMAAYARDSEQWDFYEIDPAVIRVAQDLAWFSFLAECRAGSWRVIEGDARLRLGDVPEATYDLLVLDAFSSDAIPVHLLTREALGVYRARLKPGGWLAVHLSNRYLELEPVVAALAEDAGWVSRSYDDTAEGDYPGKEASHWMVLAADEASLGSLTRRSAWVAPSNDARLAPWTDRRAPVWEVFSWR